MSFGKNLRTLIEERDITQKELARQLNIAPSTLGSYVQDAREPDFNTLKSLAAYFNVSIDYLLDYTPDQIKSHQENELLRIFRSLTAEQRDICLEQCKVFVRVNNKEQESRRKSS
ncbi:MAG: helix-turn-helix domain-containing protein [Lachnospiraceae bacterium]|nr:helix-turn-helix domain-containing protein [Lachnospiraceae bacterium]